ncbi:MAG: hypothetical protein ACWA40_02215 [Planktomarina sp.]
MRILFVILAFLLPFSAAAGTQTVTEDWPEVVIPWQSGSEMYLRYAVFDNGGKVEVCIAVTSRRNVPYELIQASLERAYLEIEGQGKALRNSRFAKIYSSRYRNGNLIGQEAKCKVSKMAFPSGAFRYGLIFPSGRYTYSR